MDAGNAVSRISERPRAPLFHRLLAKNKQRETKRRLTARFQEFPGVLQGSFDSGVSSSVCSLKARLNRTCKEHRNQGPTGKPS